MFIFLLKRGRGITPDGFLPRGPGGFPVLVNFKAGAVAAVAATMAKGAPLTFDSLQAKATEPHAHEARSLAMGSPLPKQATLFEGVSILSFKPKPFEKVLQFLNMPDWPDPRGQSDKGTVDITYTYRRNWWGGGTLTRTKNNMLRRLPQLETYINPLVQAVMSHEEDVKKSLMKDLDIDVTIRNRWVQDVPGEPHKDNWGANENVYLIYRADSDTGTYLHDPSKNVHIYQGSPEGQVQMLKFSGDTIHGEQKAIENQLLVAIRTTTLNTEKGGYNALMVVASVGMLVITPIAIGAASKKILRKILKKGK